MTNLISLTFIKQNKMVLSVEVCLEKFLPQADAHIS